MNTRLITQGRSRSIAMPVGRMRRGANDEIRAVSSRIAGRAIVLARRRRERVLSCLAFILLIAAWDATLRLDERVSPSRMRVSHAVERESEAQMQTFAP
jgi:hypothetical protein